MGDERVYLNNRDNFNLLVTTLRKISSQNPKLKIYLKKDSEYYDSLNETEYFLFKINSDTNELLLANFSNERKIIKISIDNPSESDLDALQLLNAEKYDDDSDSMNQTLIIDEESDIRVIEEIKEISEFDRVYEYDKIRDSLVNQLNDFYNSRVNIDDLYSTATSIIDLIEKYKVFDNEELKKSALMYSDNYKPLYNRLIDNRFNGTNIFPIVYDQKKHYSDVYKNADNAEEDDILLPDYKFLDFKTELLDQITLNNKFLATNYKNKNKSLKFLQNKNVIGQSRKSSVLEKSDFMNFKEVLDRLHSGGSYQSPEDPSITVTTDSILRSYINDNQNNNMSSYTLTADRNIFVYRAVSDNNPLPNNSVKYNIRNPEKTTELGEKKNMEVRLAEGPIHMLEDQFDSIFISESRGKHNRTITCNGTNKTGDNFYMGTNKKSDLNKKISTHPKKVQIVDGEKLNVVGFYIKSINNIEENIINGDEIIQGDEKIYPQVYNNGLSLASISINKKKSKTVVIDDYRKFDMKNYDPTLDYIVYFNKNQKEEINHEKYTNILDSILPGIDNILKLEKDNLKSCANIIDIAKILNRYNIDLTNINKNNFRILGKFMRDKIDKHNNYNRWINSRYLEEKNNIAKYNKIYKSLVDIINSTQNSDISTLPNVNYVENIKKIINKKVSQYLKQHQNSEIYNFCINYLDINNPKSMDMPTLIKNIIDVLLQKHNLDFYNSELTKYFVDNKNLVDEEYIELYNDFKNIYAINHTKFPKIQYGHIDVDTLQQLEFMSLLKKTKNNGRLLVEIINISNLKKLGQYSATLIDQFGEKNYKKLTGLDNWGTLNSIEKQKYIPNSKQVQELEEQSSEIMNSYNEQRVIYDYYVSKCNGLRIIKKYNSEDEILRDNDIDTYYDKEFDTTIEDIKLYNKIGDNDDELRANLKIRYVYDSLSEIDNKIQNIKDNLYSGLNKRKTKNGDMALVNTPSGKKVYRRHGGLWLPVTDQILSTIDKCFAYDREILSMDIDTLYDYCTDIKDDDKNLEDTDCIDLDSPSEKRLPDRLYKLLEYHKIINNKKDDIAYIIKFTNDIDSLISTKLEIVKNKSELYKNIEKIKQNNIQNTDTHSRKPQIDRVYPPLELLEKLNGIKKIDDFDLMMEELDKFIQLNGIDHSKNKHILKNNPNEGKPSLSKNYYYNIDSITEPMICKHYTELISVRFRDNKTKEKVFNSVKQKWGKEDGENFYCTNCGEIVGYAKYSDWEGFGKNDKAIMVREIIEDEPEDISERMQNENSIVRQVINTMSLLCNVKLTNDDHLLVVNIYNSLKDSPAYKYLNFSDFYYQVLKTDNKLKPIIVKKLSEIESSYDTMNIENVRLYAQKISIPGKAAAEATLKKVFTELVPAIYQGYIYYTQFVLLMTIYIEVYRTGIPDYPSCSTGAERLSKQKSKASTVISDFYYNEDYAISFFISKLYNQLKNTDTQNKNTSKEFKLIKIYLENKAGVSNIETFFGDRIRSIIKEIKNNSTIDTREKSKESYKLLESLDSEKINIEYDWKNFVPSLDFIIDYTYSVPNIEYKLSEISKLYNSIQNIHTSIETSSNPEYQETLKTKLLEYNKLTTEIDEIAYKLSYLLITKINKINFTTEQESEIYAKRWQSYTSSLGYDYISNDYFLFYISKDYTIGNDLENLRKIYNADINNINNNINSKLTLVKNTRAYDNLQKFMKFDRSLYKTQSEIRRILVNKLKAINYIYILDGPNAGKKRIFRDINDLDYHKLIEIYSKNPEINESDLDIELSKVLSKDTLPADFVDFKIKIIKSFKGKAEIDIVSLDFKEDIATSIDNQVKDKTEKEINDIIDDFEINSSSNIYKNEHGLIEGIKEKNNIELQKEKMVEFINNYLKIFTIDDDKIDSSEMVGNLISIEGNSDINIMQFVKQNILGSNLSDNREKITNAIKHVNSDLSVDYIDTVLSDICSIDALVNENKKDTEKLIRIEYGDSQTSEYKVRDNIIRQNKLSNIIHIQVSIIRYIVLILNQLYNGIGNNFVIDEYKNTRKTRKILNRDDFTNIVEINSIDESMIRDTITSLLGEDIDRVEEDTIMDINNFLESITFYSDNINIGGDIIHKYVSNPYFMKPLLSNIIIYLMSFLNNDDPEDNKLILLLDHIFKHVVDTCKINSILNKEIEESIKKKRANENIKRKERFDKLDDEQKDVQRLMRRMNLGNLYDWDENKDMMDNVEELLTTEAPVDDIENPEMESDAILEDSESIGPIVIGAKDGVMDYDNDFGDDGNDDEDE